MNYTIAALAFRSTLDVDVEAKGVKKKVAKFQILPTAYIDTIQSIITVKSAQNEEDARKTGMEWALKEWPKIDGWRGHSVVVRKEDIVEE